MHVPYTGSIKFRTRSIDATIAMVTIDHLRINLDDGEKPKLAKWDSLAFAQYIAFFEFFAQKRLDMEGGAVASDKTRMKEAGMEYFLAALICDWYGRYDDAAKLAKRAIETDKSFVRIVDEILLFETQE